MPSFAKSDFSAVQGFSGVVLEAHVIAVAMEYFGMSTVGQLPACHVFPPNHVTAPTSIVEKYVLSDTVGEFVDELVQHCFDAIVSMRRDMQSLKPNKGVEMQHDVPTAEVDRVFDYARAVVGHGLLALNMQDASHHGDGMRLYRCWKLLLLHFQADQQTKYAFSFPHEVLWNRSCNPHGGVGMNIPLDLQEEYLNRVFNDDTNNYRANITDASVRRSANGIGPM